MTQFPFASLLHRRTWTQFCSPLRIFYELIFDIRRVNQKILFSWTFIYVWEKQTIFRRVDLHLSNNLPSHLAKTHLMIKKQKEKKWQELSWLCINPTIWVAIKITQN